MSLAARITRPGRVLPKSFYDRETELVARDLLGAVLECTTDAGTVGGIIVETEAYIGEHDEACHAFAGLTKRTAPLYGAPGTSYVYFIYGMYWCFNAVTRAEGLPSAVLVRALEPLKNVELMREHREFPRREIDLTNGPGKLCEALGIDGKLNGLQLQRGALVIRQGITIPESEISVTPRIGITKATDWPLRWIVRDSSYISQR